MEIKSCKAAIVCFTRAFHIGTETIAVMRPPLRPVPCRVTHQAGQEWLWRAGEATCCSGSPSGKTTEDKGTKVLSCSFYSVIWIITDYTHSTLQRTFDPVTRLWKPHILVLVFQERELVLKRIAEDRKSQQEKMQAGASSEKSPPSGQEQKLGGKVQTNVDNNCLLMVKLQTIKTHTADSSNLTCIFNADSVAVGRVHARALPCWRSSTPRRGAHSRAPSLPAFLFSRTGFPPEALRRGGAHMFAALPRPHTECGAVHSDHSSGNAARDMQSCRPSLSGAERSISMRGVSTAVYPCPGGSWRAGPVCASSTSKPAVGRSSKLRWDTRSRSFSFWTVSLLG